MPALNEIVSCEVCGNDSLRRSVDLGSHPMCDDLVPVGEERVCEEYPIDILFCDRCITAHQRFQIPKRELFPASYHYRSRHTADVLNGMRQLAAASDEALGGLRGKKVLDIGCNDGSLLTIFAEHGASTFGIEPTGAAADALERGHVIVNDFFDERVARAFVGEHGHPDLITFTNVFAHIEDLRGMLRALKILCSSRTAIVIENHYLGAVLQKKQFDTFYHEHPRTYSYTSFAFIADALGMRIGKVDFPARYGGNIRVFLTQMQQGTQHDRWEELRSLEKSFGDDLQHLSGDILVWKTNKLAQLQAEFTRHGKLAAKAFPGRAAILVQLLGLDERLISAAYEKSGSGKIGHFVPGTRIPIVSDDEFVPGDSPVVNLAWHISDEIATYMRSRGYSGRIIDIIAPEDFGEKR